MSGLAVIKGGAGAAAPAPVPPTLDAVAAAVVATPGVVATNSQGKPGLVPLRAVEALRAELPLAWRADEPWVWGGQCWVPGEAAVRRICQHIGAAVAPRGTGGITSGDRLFDLLAVELRAAAPATPEETASTWDARPLWPCENGTVVLSDPAHPLFQSGVWDPDDRMTYRIAAPWHEQACDMAVVDWLQTALPDPDVRGALLEFLGYALTRSDLRFQVLAFLVGHGANGKGTFLRVLSHLLPGYLASVDLATLARDRFAGSCLVRAVVNAVGDQPGRFLTDTAAVKQLTGQDPVHGERKFRDAYVMYPKVTNIFALNELPRTDDVTHGWLRRLLILPFPTRFGQTGGFDETRLWTPAARATWLQLAATGYARLCARGGFDWRAPGLAAPRNEYRQDLDVVARAVGEDVLRLAPDARIPAPTLQLLVRLYAESLGQKAPRRAEIVRRAQALGQVREERPGPRGTARQRQYAGLGAGAAAWAIELPGSGQLPGATLAERAGLTLADKPPEPEPEEPDNSPTIPPLEEV